MTSSEKIFAEKFRLGELKLCEEGDWRISVRPIQPTPLSLVVSLIRSESAFGNLTRQELQSLGSAIKVAEDLIKSKASPVVVNVLGLMLVDKHVHFHIIPRYDSPVLLGNQVFFDEEYPLPISNLSPINRELIRPEDVFLMLNSPS